MKTFACFLVALLAGVALAQDATIAPFKCDGNAFVCKLKEVGHHASFHFGKLGNSLADVGTSILGAVLDQGSDLLANGAQAVLGTVLQHLSDTGLGKREMGLLSKVKEHFSSGVELMKNIRDTLKAKFEASVGKLLSTLRDTATLKGIEEDADKKIDAVVAKFKEAGKGGIFQMAATITQKIRDIWAEAKAALAKTPTEKRALLDFFNSAKDTLSNLTGQLADTFKPHLDALTAGVSGLADQVKGHASNLVDAAKGHFETLKGKLGEHLTTLQGHASTLGDHANNALSALSQAVSDIVSQTAGAIGKTVGDAVGTGIDAVNVIGNHVNNAVSGN